MLKEIFEKLIGNAIVQAGRAIKVHNLELFAKKNFDITPEQYVVLSMLNEDTLFYQNKLCEQLYKDKSNMTRILSVLGKNGYIEKICKTENKKQVNKIKITKKGKELRNKILPLMQNSREKYLEHISADDMYICIKVLSKIQENLANKD
ncbi:MAG: MarR family transcriptional regulator [Candidatus Gastranaerophilales bacterium]|nr:MarR family transcriptional regulator [Candidatus Gastranaerophilales bacterium]